jgi:hypothetical protein
VKEQVTLWDVHLTVWGRWWRSAAFLGSPPGSNKGFWRTDACGLKGWNYRVGPYRRCLTAFVHTHLARP